MSSINRPANVDGAYLWIQACELLKWHNKGADTCIDTLNRLWRKHIEVRAPDGQQLLAVPQLTEDMLAPKMQLWSLNELLRLTRSHKRDLPQFFGPILVLRWFNRNFLLDGTTRINFWAQRSNAGPHAVLLLEERVG